MSSIEANDPLANERGKPDTKWGVPGYVHSLYTENLEGDGVKVERLLHRSKQPVQGGGGVRTVMPHVEYVLEEPVLSPEARQRLIKHGYQLVRGELLP